jgi:peptidoglycan/LPS O-acetylase OafA/YrhL
MVDRPPPVPSPAPRVYRNDIDGLRAVAVVGVLLFHFRVAGFEGGYVGVDVFYVISGFLMIGILDRKEQLTFRGFLEFANRRFWRLFPALFAMLIVATAGAALLYLPTHYLELRVSQASAATYTSNVVIWSEFGNYFSSGAELLPVLHTWSLAVEVQFYLGLAAIYLLKPSWRRALLIVGFFVSYALSHHGVNNYRSATFYLVPPRFWEFLLGGVALYLPKVPPTRRSLGVAGSLLGLAMVVAPIFLYSADTVFPGPGAIIPCIGTTLIIWLGRDLVGDPVSRSLSVEPMRFLGRISYSLYVWHWPMLVFLHYYLVRTLSLVEVVIGLAVIVPVSWLSWKLLENPPRKFAARYGLVSLAWFVVATLLMTAAVRFTPSMSLIPEDRAARAAAILEARPHALAPCLTSGSFDDLPASCLEGGGSDTLLWGDSHANQYVPLLGSAFGEPDWTVRQVNKTACRPIPGLVPDGAYDNCQDFNDDVQAWLAAQPAIRRVILIGDWRKFAAEHAALESLITSLVDEGREVLLFGPTPAIGIDVPNCLARRVAFDWPAERCPDLTMDAFEEVDGAIARDLSAVAERTGAQLFLPHEAFCRDGVCPAAEGDQPLWGDGGHLDPVGVARMQPFLESTLRSGGWLR